VRFRPARLSSADLPESLACRFQVDHAPMGPYAVLDLGTTGLGIASAEDLIAPGAKLEALELLRGDRLLWSGSATAVHATDGRIGARFDSGMVDLHALRLEATLDERLAVWKEQRERLPHPWRARVSDMRQLLEDAKLELDEMERANVQDPLRRHEDEAELFERLHKQWGAAFSGEIAALYELSKPFDARTRALGRSYAASALMPLLIACPMHRRAYEKPFGYAGDFRMMELCFAPERTGDGLFGRFMQSIAQGYSLVRAVVEREVVLRDAVRTVLEADTNEPGRILSLAAGPAIELRRILEGTPNIKRPVELVLLDQDEGAHETAHQRLTRLLLERHRGALPITLKCLHFSVRQLLKPETPEERGVVDETLADMDLIYSAGLVDYLPDAVAVRLTQLAYSKLRPGGRLLLGNLIEAADTTWMLDVVLNWQLQYRTDAQMLHFAAGLVPAPSKAGITRDSTGCCVFLDITRAA
jgi:extracellular factor (EF) 3-hydroxypalmitic acid methyl ester biosynthesis protein